MLLECFGANSFAGTRDDVCDDDFSGAARLRDEPPGEHVDMATKTSCWFKRLPGSQA